MKYRYGITIQDYDALLEAQGFACKICGDTEPRNVRGERFPIDHCHDTGLVRGLLCHHCNVGLGHFKHDTALLDKAAAYLACNGATNALN